jgi:FKBP-type peptidyl-prolyl cis-trans isomerase FkpA
MNRWVLALLGLLAVGCGKDTRRAAIEAIRSAANPPEPPPDTVPEFLDYAADLKVDLSEMAKLPEGVLYRDLESGSGPEVAPGDSVLVHYQGWLPNGILVDSALMALKVGSGAALPGIDAALPGMKVGGVRKLVLTPGLAYGVEGTGGIPPSAVLVYDVEVRARLP